MSGPAGAGIGGSDVMAMSLEAAAEAFREAMREAVRRYSLWYLVDGGLLVAAGLLAVIYPAPSSSGARVLLGWLLLRGGPARRLGPVGTRQGPPFWLQLTAAGVAVPGP